MEQCNCMGSRARSSWVVVRQCMRQSSRAGQGGEWAVTHPGNGESRRDPVRILIIFVRQEDQQFIQSDCTVR